MHSTIIGRRHELDLIEAVLSRTGDGPTGLLLRGEPGIGKSALLEEAGRRAAGEGWLVLGCVAGERETRLAFTGLGDLLADLPRELLEELPPPQRRALESALLLTDLSGVVDPRALRVGVQSLLRRLAEDRPVLLAIDDLQWLDGASGSVLEFALRRSSPERIAMITTTRADPGSVLPIDTTRVLGGLEELAVGPLGVGSLFRLLRDRLGLELPRPALVRLHQACGGNPLFAIEVGRELEDGRLRLSPGEPIPLPAGLLALVEQRLRRLEAQTRDVLAAASALARPSIDTLAAVFGAATVERAVSEAAGAAVADADRWELRFDHPLFASASYSTLTTHARRSLHRRLAAVVGDPEERARHLALATARRDEKAAEALTLAAVRAAARGATADAAELVELAIDLTPTGNDGARSERMLRAVEMQTTAGALVRARSLGAGLLEELPAGPRRAEAALALARASESDLERMASLVGEALEEPGIDDRLRALLLGQLAEARFRQGHAHDALEPARQGLELARRAGDTRVVLGLAAHLATVEFWSGKVDDEGAAALRDYVELERRAGLALPFTDSPRATLATRLVHLGRMDEARELFVETLAEAETRGDERTRARALWHLAQLEDYAGNWLESQSYVERAAELEEQLGVESGAVYFARAGHAAVLGRVEETERLVAEGVARAREAGDIPYELLTQGVLGFLRFSLGDAEGATSILRPIVERALEISEPRVNRYWPDTVEALVAAGDAELAERYLDLYAAEATRLGVPRSLARAAHCRGVLEAASGDPDGALESFHEALAIHERCPNVFEHARTLLALGTARRRFKQRRAAREALEQALAIFESLPSPLWADRARAELARTGARRRAGDELTETEEQVARLAAQGLTNREIAAQAFLAPKSVEHVLARVYRKLGVHSRAELGARMASAPSATS